MSWRKVTVFALLLVCAVSFSVFAQKKTDVSVFGWLTTYAKPFSEVFKAEVEKKYPNINLVFRESIYEETSTQYLLMAQSGDAPDVAYTELIMSNELANIGALEDLKKWLPKKVIDDMAPAAYEACLFKGELTSAIWDISPYCLFYNAKLLKDTGFSKPPRTFKDFEKFMYGLKGKKDGAGNKIWGTNIAGLDDLHVPFLSSPWLYNFGGEWFDKNGAAAINNPQGVEMLTWFKKLYDDTIFGPVPIDRETDRTLFMEGHAGAIGEGPWQRGIWRDRSGQGEKFDAFWMLDTYPTRDGKPGKSLMWSSNAAIMKAAKHKKEAAQVIEMWVSDPKVVLAYGRLNGGIPAVKSIQSLAEVQNDPYRKVFVSAIQAGGKLPFSPYATLINEFSTLCARASHDILLNDAPIQKTLDSLAEEMDRIVESK